MKNEGTPDETDGEVAVEEAKDEDRSPPPVQKVVGMIVAAILIFLAQRDLRKRPPELVRGRVGVWKVVAMVGPGALAYLLFGRRRAAPTLATSNLNDV